MAVARIHQNVPRRDAEFAGKLAPHPRQVAIINTPDAADGYRVHGDDDGSRRPILQRESFDVGRFGHRAGLTIRDLHAGRAGP